MKSNTFNYSLLAVGVAAVMGLSTGANAAESTAVTKDAVPINNVATATYVVSGVSQSATSNTVTVNISESANFSLVATSDNDTNIDANSDRPAVPGGTTSFTHTLSNIGNVADTYTINTIAENNAAINTPNATTPVAVGSENYLFGNKTVTYTIVPSTGNNDDANQQTAALAAVGQAATGSVINGQTIKLPPKYQANLTYSTVTPTEQLGGQVGIGTLTATSNFKAEVRTLTNENQTLVKLPVFKIEKSATCGPTSSNCTTLDLNSTTPQITYSIKVTNVNLTYSDTANNFIVRDVLPAGMTVTPANATAAGVTTTIDNNITTLSKTIASLAPGASETITFIVDVNRASYTAAGSSATNNATVYDKFDNTLPTTTNFDIVDSTDTLAANNVTRLPTAVDTVGGAGTNGGTGVDTTTTISFTNRNIVLSNVTNREIAPISGTAGQVTHQTVITNSGQDAEGTTANALTFTITDGVAGNEVRPVVGPISVVYTAPPVGSTPGVSGTAVTLQPTTNGGNTYTISTNSAINGGNGIAPGGKLTISYKVSSGTAGTPDTLAALDTVETTTVTLTNIAGNGAPNVANIAAVNDITTVKGLKLDKFQALDKNCNGTIETTSGDIDFAKATINASPSECVIYRIDGTNTSSAIQTASTTAVSGFNITGLTLSDLVANFSAGATYVDTTAVSTGPIGTASANSTSISATMSGSDALAPQGSASLKFRVKIKNTGLPAAP